MGILVLFGIDFEDGDGKKTRCFNPCLLSLLYFLEQTVSEMNIMAGIYSTCTDCLIGILHGQYTLCL